MEIFSPPRFFLSHFLCFESPLSCFWPPGFCLALSSYLLTNNTLKNSKVFFRYYFFVTPCHVLLYSLTFAVISRYYKSSKAFCDCGPKTWGLHHFPVPNRTQLLLGLDHRIIVIVIVKTLSNSSSKSKLQIVGKHDK